MVPAPSATIPDGYQARGRERIDGAIEIDPGTRLAVGSYPIAPASPDGRMRFYAAAFHGGARSLAEASAIDLDAATERAGIDIRLSAVPGFTVRGAVRGPAEAIGGLPIRLVPTGLETVAVGAEAASAVTRADGRFTFIGVPAGSYSLDVPVALNQYTVGPTGLFFGIQLPSPPGLSAGRDGSIVMAATPRTHFWNSRLGSSKFWASARVTVADRDVNDATLTLTPTTTIAGRIVAEIDPRFPALTSARLPVIRIESADGNPALARRAAASDGSTSFVVSDVVPGAYLVRLYGGDAAWTLKSAVWDGADRARLPMNLGVGESASDVVVTLTNATTRLRGVIRGAAGAGDAGATTIAFPVSRDEWELAGATPLRVVAAAASTSGQYTLRLPAGEYFVIAVPGAQDGLWREPELLSRAAAVATRVNVAWGDDRVLDLAVREVR
jgi:hypothetical protein